MPSPARQQQRGDKIVLQYAENKSDRTRTRRERKTRERRGGEVLTCPLGWPSLSVRYAPRSRSIYVASLYRDPSALAATADDGNGALSSCPCGGLDPLHCFDPLHGTVPVAQAAASFRGHHRLRRELEVRTCEEDHDASSSPSSRREVDQLCGMLSAPSCARASHSGDCDLRAPGITFEQWSVAVHQRLTQEEAERKRVALADLAYQVKRRARAQEEYRLWLEMKAAEAHQEHEATKRTTTRDKLEGQRKHQPPLTAEEEVARQQANQAQFEAWCSDRDRARALHSRLARSLARDQTKTTKEAASERSRLGAQAFDAWKAQRAKEEVRVQREQQQRVGQGKTDDEATRRESEATKAKAAQEYAIWLARTTEQRQQQEAIRLRSEAAADDARRKRAEQVDRTRADQERQIARAFARIQREKRAAALQAEAEQQRAHRLTWKKKTPGEVVAYSTSAPERRKVAFR